MSTTKKKAPTLQRLTLSEIQEHSFHTPKKCINEGHDVVFFLSSYAYTDLVTFLLQLTASVFPRRASDGSMQVWELGSPAVRFSPTVTALRSLLSEMDTMIEKHPPDTGPRRFGNVAFRGWYTEMEQAADALLEKYLPDEILGKGGDREGQTSSKVEIKAYLLGAWGSAQRLDYGTGHELSFLAFLGCLWKLGAFAEASADGGEERGIVLGVIDPYLSLVRRLIKTYTLEPAGSHGVWGLDDHSFLPYVFGSAQLGPPMTGTDRIPTEGSLPGAPNPADVAKATVVEHERVRNMYFGAVGFIFDVKKGPFWEHSPMLFDISGVSAGWAKINKGMIKMYMVEVLSKFPVVQHFPFGTLFKWERDPNATPPPASAHATSHTTPNNRGSQQTAPWSSSLSDPRQPSTGIGTQAPWAKPTQGALSMASATAAPSRIPGTTTAAPLQMRAPWAPAQRDHPGKNTSPTNGANDAGSTRAPWAK